MARILLAAASAFVISAAVGWFLIPVLRALHAGQSIKEIGPTWHKNKEGTPTMGGIMFILAAAVVVLAMMAAFIALIVWGFTVDAADAPPIGVVIGLAAIPVIVIIGVLAALYQRIKQIRGGEEDAAAQY